MTFRDWLIQYYNDRELAKKMSFILDCDHCPIKGSMCKGESITEKCERNMVAYMDYEVK